MGPRETAGYAAGYGGIRFADSVPSVSVVRRFRWLFGRFSAFMRPNGAGDTALVPPVVVGTAIVRDGLLLVQQRAYPAELAGLWELPGGRVEAGETDAEAVRRECREELGVEVVVGERVGPDVPLPGGKVLRVFAATLREGEAEPRAVEHRPLRGSPADELAELDWLPADRVLVPALRELVGTDH